MSVALSLGIIGVRLSLSTIGTMASKRAGSKDTIESVTRDAVEQVSNPFLAAVGYMQKSF